MASLACALRVPGVCLACAWRVQSISISRFQPISILQSISIYLYQIIYLYLCYRNQILDALSFMVIALRKASLMSGQSSAVRFLFFGLSVYLLAAQHPMEFHRVLLNSIGSYGITQDPMEFHRILLEFHRILWNFIGSYGIPKDPMEFHRILWNPIGSFSAGAHSYQLPATWPPVLARPGLSSPG